MYKILIVDDEHLIVNGLSNGINWNNMGFEISGTASDGTEAIKCIEQDTPDVILTDIRMPFMDGMELIKRIKIIDRQIKIVILSGYDDFGYAQKAIEYGISSYLLKPLKEEEIADVFHKLFMEIESEKAMHYRYTKMCKRLNSNKYILFGNLLMKYINRGSFDKNDFKMELVDIGINLFEKHICSIAFCYDIKEKDCDIKLENEYILHEAINYWNSLNYPVFINSDVFHIIANNSSNLDIKELKGYLETFKKYIEDKISSLFCNVFFSFGIGSCSQGFNEIGKSLYDSTEALKYRFYNGRGSIIHYNDIQGKKNAISDTDAVDKFIMELEKAIMNEIQINIHNNTVLFFNNILYRNFCDPNLLYIKLVEIYLLIANRIEEKRLHIQVMKSEEIYNCFKCAGTFAELTDIFGNLMMELYEQVRRVKSGCNNSLIFEIENYINNNYFKKISLQELSDTFFINSSYLSTLFKKATKENISDYIQKVRIENAKKYLKELKCPIPEIAEKTGFADYRYFCLVFKKATGVSPLQYRMKLTY